MSDYRESAVTGTTWQRCCQIVIANPRGAVPTVRFDEESVLALADGTEIRRPVGALALDFDPAKVIELRDPATGELTGDTSSYGAVYTLLYSAYMTTALERDTPAQPIQGV
jgi:hypothetical protein